MGFIQHIQDIDKRIEERREQERQKTLFGMDGDFDGGAAGSPHESLKTTRYIGNNGPTIDVLNRESLFH